MLFRPALLSLQSSFRLQLVRKAFSSLEDSNCLHPCYDDYNDYNDDDDDDDDDDGDDCGL